MSLNWPFSRFSRHITGILYDRHHEGVLITDHQGILVYYNQRMADLDGLAPENIIGRHVLDIYKLEAQDCISTRCLAAGRPILNAALYYKATEGKLVNALCNAYPIDEDGLLAGCICYTAEYTSMADRLDLTARNYAKHPQAQAAAPPVKSPGTGAVHSLASLIGESQVFKAALETARVGARTPSSVLISGETGSGKELFAQAIHNHSPRRSRPFCPINCAAIPENLLEGILFGTVKGAFTGAMDREGLFEVSSGGTIFLDEIHTMPMGLQAKLLRVIQERRIRRVGSLAEKELDLKIISSVNQRPEKAVEEGLMRPDLFYRLGVVLLNVPPLRYRGDDIELLVKHFVKKYNKILNGRVEAVEPEFLAIMRHHDWPGNVRELEHVVETALNFAASDPINDRTLGLRHIQSAHLRKFLSKKTRDEQRPRPASVPVDEPEPGGPKPLITELAQTERQRLIAALEQAGGNMSRAARSLGLSRQNLYYKIKKYQLKEDSGK